MNAACVVYIWLDPVACGWQQCSCILSVPACTIRTLRNVDRQGIWGRWIDLLLLNRRPQQRGIDIHSCTVRVMLYTYTVILRLVFVSCYSYYTNYTTCVWVRVRVELECVCVPKNDVTQHLLCSLRRFQLRRHRLDECARRSRTHVGSAIACDWLAYYRQIFLFICWMRCGHVYVLTMDLRLSQSVGEMWKNEFVIIWCTL